jgi:hypothetical protein
MQIEAILMLTPFPTTSHSLLFLVYYPPHPIQKPIRYMHYEMFKVKCIITCATYTCTFLNKH